MDGRDLPPVTGQAPQLPASGPICASRPRTRRSGWLKPLIVYGSILLAVAGLLLVRWSELRDAKRAHLRSRSGKANVGMVPLPDATEVRPARGPQRARAVAPPSAPSPPPLPPVLIKQSR